MIHIDMASETEQSLRHSAQVWGQPLESYLRRILDIGASPLSASDASQVATFEQALNELAADFFPHAPLPAHFSRVDRKRPANHVVWIANGISPLIVDQQARCVL